MTNLEGLNAISSSIVSPESAGGHRPTILVLLGAFWPGHEATGPNQSLIALVKGLKGNFDFKIVGRDRPFGASEPLAPAGIWTDIGYAQIRYSPISAFLGARDLSDILRTTSHDLLLMNGFFDREFTIPALLLRYAGRVPRLPTILSTRGEFGGGALVLKSRRKRIYMEFARRVNLLDGVWLHATSPQEAGDIGKSYPFSRGTFIAPNIRQLESLPAACNSRKRSSLTRLAFLGRITPVKNLHYALAVLSRVKSEIAFDIYGPVQEKAYWQDCQRSITRLPPNITVTYRGIIANDSVGATLAGADLFFLPTCGENFGHAILDALAAGLPVLISDQTPFQNLQCSNAGWSLSLDQPEKFVEVIEAIAAMPVDERMRLRVGARDLADRMTNSGDAIATNLEMFMSAVRAGPCKGKHV
jgi:glycosyltransferase involved in cell wall biosynthesis